MRILLNGAGGRTGQEVARLAQARGDEVLPFDARRELMPACRADVLIDFSHPDATATMLSFCCTHRLPVCIGTTGQDRGQLHAIAAAAEQIPVFRAANFSLGIALLDRLLRMTLSVFPAAEIEILEAHHGRKLDAPSGTALALAEAVRDCRPASFPLTGRSGTGVRDPNEVGIHAIRIGQTTGTHEVLLGIGDETLSLRHEAHSRAPYATGALAAADFLTLQPPGIYGMADLLGMISSKRSGTS